jgi:hypothetical protein
MDGSNPYSNPAKSNTGRKDYQEEKRLIFKFIFDRSVNTRIKQIPGWKWAGKDWSAPTAQAMVVMQNFPDFEMPDDIAALQQDSEARPVWYIVTGGTIGKPPSAVCTRRWGKYPRRWTIRWMMVLIF